MKLTEALLETIERYLKLEMEPSEKLAFEEKLQNDPELVQEVEGLKNLFTGIEAAALKRKMEVFHQGIPQETPVRALRPSKDPKKIRYLVAACLVALLGIFWFFKRETPQEQLFAKYYAPDPGLPTTMSTTNEYDFYHGMVNYKQGNYPAALTIWEPLLLDKPQNDTLNYFIGVTYLAKGNTAEAIPFLEKVSSQKESIFWEDSHYYLGFSYLKKGDLEAAKQNFGKSNHPEAQKIVNALEKE